MVATQRSANYCEMCDKLKAAIQSKYQGQLLQGVLFLYKTDNPQTVIRNIEILWQLHFEVLEHPLYRPDVAPSDHHLLVSLKDILRHHPFNTDHKAKEMVHKSLTTQPTFLLRAYRNLFNAGQSIMTIRRIMCKNDASTHFLTLQLH